MLGNRCVDDAAGAKLVQQALRDLVCALVLRDFLAHQHDGFVAAHFFGHGVAEGFADRGRNHFRSLGIVRRAVNAGHLGRCSCHGRFFCRRCCGFGSGRRGGGSSDVVGAFAFFDKYRDRRVHLHALGPLGDQDLADDAFIDGLEFHRGLVSLDFRHDVA